MAAAAHRLGARRSIVRRTYAHTIDTHARTHARTQVPVDSRGFINYADYIAMMAQ